jgi:hypothetical protein
MWILFNEDWGGPPPDFQHALVRRMRAADPTRLVVDASGWNQLDDTDLVDVHDYGDDLSRHENEPDRPLWIGECGGVSLVWTQLTDVEGELNGLLTDERLPKAGPAAIRAVNERFRRR